LRDLVHGLGPIWLGDQMRRVFAHLRREWDSCLRTAGVFRLDELKAALDVAQRLDIAGKVVLRNEPSVSWCFRKPPWHIVVVNDVPPLLSAHFSAEASA
jgi:hypothetical protein